MKTFLCFVIALCSCFNINAQDADGCVDHSLIKRLPNTFITECVTDTNEMEFTIYPDSVLRLNGIKSFIAYGHDELKAKIAPSFSKIVKSYETRMLKQGGRKMYYSEDAGTATFYLPSGNKKLWCVIDDGGGDGEGYYSITVLEPLEN